MNSVEDTGSFGSDIRLRPVRRRLYVDWAIFFTAVAILGAVVMVDFAIEKTNSVTGTIDRLNSNDPGVLASGEIGASR